MKIAFAIKSMAAQGGGAERVLAQIASGLAKKGHQITILTFDHPVSQSFYPLHPTINFERINIGDPERSARFYETARRIVALRERMKAIRPDVAVGFMHSMFVPLGLALLGTGIPLLGSDHIVYEHYQQRPLQALLLRLAPFLTRLITVVSEQAHETYPSALRAHMKVVPNPVHVSSTGRADVVGAAEERKKLLVVGRLEEQKGHVHLIEAFSNIAGRVPDWDLRIVGEGSLRPALESQLSEHGLEQRVQLPGAISDISQEYISAQLFVMPSLYESFGLATAEALAHGLPCVGFADCPGTNKLIQSGENGVLVDAGEARDVSLAQALEPLMKDAEARTKLLPPQVQSQGSSLASSLDVWDKVLRSLTNASGSGHQKKRFQQFSEHEQISTVE